ncbi:hypothetical protein M758_6G054600 [Ceratodon purpureus]|nr:hypothetical protein M758_6G054600 [Ceratodon purpureus]
MLIKPFFCLTFCLLKRRQATWDKFVVPIFVVIGSSKTWNPEWTKKLCVMHCRCFTYEVNGFSGLFSGTLKERERHKRIRLRCREKLNSTKPDQKTEHINHA